MWYHIMQVRILALNGANAVRGPSGYCTGCRAVVDAPPAAAAQFADVNGFKVKLTGLTQTLGQLYQFLIGILSQNAGSTGK